MICRKSQPFKYNRIQYVERCDDNQQTEEQTNKQKNIHHTDHVTDMQGILSA